MTAISCCPQCCCLLLMLHSDRAVMLRGNADTAEQRANNHSQVNEVICDSM
jgi:hypothetical protein